MENRFIRNLQILLALLDFLSINVVFLSTQILLHNKVIAAAANMNYTLFIFVLNLLWFAFSATCRIYNEKHIMAFELFAKRTMRAFVYFTIGVVCYLFFFRQFALSRVFIAVVLGAIPCTLLINRFLYLIFYHYYKKRDYLVTKVVVMGYNNLSKKLVSYLEEESINKRVVGFCEDFAKINELTYYPVLSQVDDVIDVCKKYGATEIYSTIAPEQNPNLYHLITEAEQNCIRFKIIPDINIFIKRRFYIDNVKEVLVLSMHREPLADLSNRIKKRAFDLVFSWLVCLFVLSWLIPLVSLLIWLESKGPVFFKQLRSGKDNRVFGCLKFRSMRVNEKANLQQATKNDTRITRVGRFLRKSSLDEFPQFINVLKGEMSIVGPRPHMLKHTDEYSQLIGQYMVRHFSKPGITGWAQVNGFRGETRTVEQMEKRVEHDLWYVENWSLWLDVKIIFMTILNLFKKEEYAY